MSKKLFLLDGMALVYRAHFALASRPIFNSKGANTSALFGFTQTLLDIRKKQNPTHLAVAFDTQAPTQRHVDYPEYKAHREAMPEDLAAALPHVRRMLEAMRVPILILDGYEADDIIGTVVSAAHLEGFSSYMVTSDKDFGQLVNGETFLYKPGRMGDSVEILGVAEIRARWGIEHTSQVVDILALMGDSSDNIPGVPGIGEKTAMKLVAQFGSLENLLANSDKLTGKIRENVEKNRELAILSKQLATIICNVPIPFKLDDLEVKPFDDQKLADMFIEFEFNSLGRRVFGENFNLTQKAEPRQSVMTHPPGASTPEFTLDAPSDPTGLTDVTVAQSGSASRSGPPVGTTLKSILELPIELRTVNTPEELRSIEQEAADGAFISIHTVADGPDSTGSKMAAFAFSLGGRSGCFVPLNRPQEERRGFVEALGALLGSPQREIIGHDLKPHLIRLKNEGITVRGRLFDTMIAHSLVEPEMRHSLDYLSTILLGYMPMPVTAPGTVGELDLATPVECSDRAMAAVETAILQNEISATLKPLLEERGQHRVFYEIESPLIPVLAEMEISGIRVDAHALNEFGALLSLEINQLGSRIHRLAEAGGVADAAEFNINSPKQLGQILFEKLKIGPAPKKTRTGQYSTDEQTLAELAPDNEIIQLLLNHRAASKLKSTYADALPLEISPRTGRIHTTFNQAATSTGRLNSQNPNLQNIPIRTERGQEIRKAFIPGDGFDLLLSADYSQIELRIIAALSQEPALLEAFRTGADVHTTTAARVYGVFPEMVTPEMRRKAKMVNYGIAYGISAFGLAQRLHIPRKEASEIINQYFSQFPGIRQFMDQTVQFARDHGYVETVTGRRRHLRDVNSSNATVRGAAERNAINAPIQGSAADMIKLAMINIQQELSRRDLRSRLLLQVHDELVFELPKQEEPELRCLVEEKMRTAMRLRVPILVEIGTGKTWLEAH